MIEKWVFDKAQKSLSHSYIDLNKDFKKALDLMENTQKHLFITGRAGTGKSTLLRYFKENTRKNVVILAPTGLAAINVSGQTIHSFFRFGARIIESKNIKNLNSKIYKEIDAIVIDEFSMVRADLFDGIDIFLRKNRSSREPFGGVQLLLFGDLYQLPPVVNEEARAIIGNRYESPYFFSSNVVEKIDLEVIELNEVYRQEEKEFIRVLDLIRNGDFKKQDLELLNTRVVETADKRDFVILTPTNKIADLLNKARLNRLSGKTYSYDASLQGGFKEHNLPIDLKLELKKGARVIFSKNDPDGRWVNGSIGTVQDLDFNFIEVKLDDGNIVAVGRATWEKIRYDYDDKKDVITSEVVGKLKQFPLRLAWALTIHKSQGQTFDNVLIDLSTHPWDHGQTYVALSRCRSLDGMMLKRRLVKEDIIVDPRISNFVQNQFGAQRKIDDFGDSDLSEKNKLINNEPMDTRLSNKPIENDSHQCCLMLIGADDEWIEEVLDRISGHSEDFEEHVNFAGNRKITISGPGKRTCAFCEYFKDFVEDYSRRTKKDITLFFEKCSH